MSRRSRTIRTRAGRWLVALGVAVATFAGASQASAFCRSTTCRSTSDHECATDDNMCPTEGSKLFWPTSCVTYAMNELGTQDLDPVQTRDTIRKCFLAWTEVPCAKGGNANFTFQERDPVSCKMSEYNKDGPNLNVVLFQDDDWTYHGIDGTLAKTSVTYNDQTGEIYDADIEVNAANNTLTITDDPPKIEYDLQAILTHEVGHFIGIAHSPNGDAVMYASYSPGTIGQRVLTPDDVDAVCTIYPPKSGVACNIEPRGGFSATCGSPAKKGCSVATVGAGEAGGSPGSSGGSSDGHGSGQNASFAVMGLGVLAAARFSRRAAAASGTGKANKTKKTA